MNLPVRVLVVDDSAVYRRLLVTELGKDKDLLVCGYARDGGEALAKIERLQPDVVTLDVEMPGPNGLETLARIMATHAIPVVMVSGASQRQAEVVVRSLEMGAVDFVAKPEPGGDSMAFIRQLAEKIKIASQVRITARRQVSGEPPPSPAGRSHSQVKIVGLAASTGGPAALQTILTRLPASFPTPIVIVQHMPPGFTAPLARRLNELSALLVKEGVHGEQLTPGMAVVAPAGSHLRVEREQGGVKVRLSEDSLVPTLFKPSADVMFASLAEAFGNEAVAGILTGMGNDGVAGLRAVKKKHGFILAQDEASCVVFGMPRAAIAAGLVDVVLPLDQWASELLKLTGG